MGEADVNFGDSGPRDKPQWYVLESDARESGQLFLLEVVLDTASLVRRVEIQD